MRLAGKVAIVTGGAGGMGRSTALLFAREGAAVVVGDVDDEAGARLAAEVELAGGRLTFRRCDVAQEADVAALVAAAEATYGKLDTIFNNAGIEQPVTPTTDVSEALFDRVIGINLKGTFFGCKHALPALLRNGGGTIVNNSSVSAFANVGGNVSYAASKGAVMSLTRVLAIEYARQNVRVNAINPGVIDTDMNVRNRHRAADPDAWLERSFTITPMGRMGTGDEIAETVLFLASDQSSFITGVGLLVDGGESSDVSAGRLAGKVAVITGAARGIGRAVVAAFAAEGAEVHAVDRLGDELRAAVDGLGSPVSPWTLDLADAPAVARTFAAIEAASGRVDVLVNNAGVIFFQPIEATSVEAWDRLMAVNLRGPFLCTRAVAAGMKARRAGAILNVSSNAGVRGGNDESAYCASKFGIEGFSRALAIELGAYGIAVNTITPGHPVHTSMSETTYAPEQRRIWKDPAELMPAFVHLALQDAHGLHDQHVRAWDLVLELRGRGAA